jgi:hypothetical protein
MVRLHVIEKVQPHCRHTGSRRDLTRFCKVVKALAIQIGPCKKSHLQCAAKLLTVHVPCTYLCTPPMLPTAALDIDVTLAPSPQATSNCSAQRSVSLGSSDGTMIVLHEKCAPHQSLLK